ncbi:MAG: type II secretion system protein N [Halieaceae bacterium]|jgi:hypothetical protein|nr:type II secretion system protein N [Halieaceae bacterium]
MKRGLLFAAAGLLLFLLALTALPARLLPALLPEEPLRLSGLSGTLLSGRAARAQVLTGAGALHLGRLRWNIDLSSLLRLRPSLQLNSEWGAQRLAAAIEWRPGRLDIRDLDASGDARLLRTVAPLAVEGRLSLQFQRVVLRGGLPGEAEGRVVWQNARWSAPQVQHDLGSYVALIEGDLRDTLTARVDTLDGPVPARGSARLADSRYEVDIVVGNGRTRIDPEIERALELFATPSEEGYRLRLSGSLILGSRSDRGP